jgi:hypothetical protein
MDLQQQEQEMEDSAEGLRADLLKLTQLLETGLDGLEEIEEDDYSNEGKHESRPDDGVGSDNELPGMAYDLSLRKRRSNRLPAGTFVSSPREFHLILQPISTI